jgi:predicted adenylyl cyclase CyaB
MMSKEEIEIKVDNYDNAILILERLGFEKWKKRTKHRTHYEFWDIHFELDTVNDIPTYLEIETQSENTMIEICNKLELDISLGKKWTIFELLPEKFTE